jgi:hypothetical protein
MQISHANPLESGDQAAAMYEAPTAPQAVPFILLAVSHKRLSSPCSSATG